MDMLLLICGTTMVAILLCRKKVMHLQQSKKYIPTFAMVS